jgi:iron complex transport system ATP-binding protein
VSAALVFQEVDVAYPGRPVLRGVSLAVEAGQVLAVVGPNGVGKSTLVKAASGILRPARGHVLVDGQEVAGLPPASRARRLAVVPQATQVPPAFTAEQVVLMGRTAYLGWLDREGATDRARASEAMRRTQIADLAGRRMGELSGGEQQRVLVARALAQSAGVLLLDEPTAHLDLRHQDEILGLVRSLAGEAGLAVLIALHDLNLVARFSDRVALLSDGGVKKLGVPEEVLTPDLLAAAYGMKIHVMDHPIHGTPLVLSG